MTNISMCMYLLRDAGRWMEKHNASGHPDDLRKTRESYDRCLAKAVALAIEDENNTSFCVTALVPMARRRGLGAVASAYDAGLNVAVLA